MASKTQLPRHCFTTPSTWAPAAARGVAGKGDLPVAERCDHVTSGLIPATSLPRALTPPRARSSEGGAREEAAGACLRSWEPPPPAASKKLCSFRGRTALLR